MKLLDCPGFPAYQVGDDGHVYRDGRKLSETVHHRTRHHRVRLYGPNGTLRGTKGGRFSNLYVHRLVCEAFWGECPDDMVLVRHLDGNSENNDPENLVWGTAVQNMRDYWDDEEAVARREERRALRGDAPSYEPDLFMGF